MTGEEVKKLIDGWAQALNNRDIERFMDYYTDDCVLIDSLTGPLRGKEAVKGFYISMMSAFPDLQFSADSVVGVSDSAAMEWTFTGTQQGAFPPFENFGATGKKVTLSGATFYDFKNSMIASERVHADYGALLEEIGIMPQVRKAA